VGEKQIFNYFLSWGETESTIGLFYKPQMIDDDYGSIGGMRIGRGTEILGEYLPQCHFVHHISYMT
jgi:hypothetical protein